MTLSFQSISISSPKNLWSEKDTLKLVWRYKNHKKRSVVKEPIYDSLDRLIESAAMDSTQVDKTASTLMNNCVIKTYVISKSIQKTIWKIPKEHFSRKKALWNLLTKDPPHNVGSKDTLNSLSQLKDPSKFQNRVYAPGDHENRRSSFSGRPLEPLKTLRENLSVDLCQCLSRDHSY